MAPFPNRLPSVIAASQQGDFVWLADQRASVLCIMLVIGNETCNTHWQSIHRKLDTNLATARRIFFVFA